MNMQMNELASHEPVAYHSSPARVSYSRLCNASGHRTEKFCDQRHISS